VNAAIRGSRVRSRNHRVGTPAPDLRSWAWAWCPSGWGQRRSRRREL